MPKGSTFRPNINWGRRVYRQSELMTVTWFVCSGRADSVSLWLSVELETRLAA